MNPFHILIQRAAQGYLLLTVAAFFVLFFVSASASQYAYYAFLAGDHAYQFYDDFPIRVEKPVWLFKGLLFASLILVYWANRAGGWQTRTYWPIAVWGVGILLILIHWNFAILSALLLASCFYPWKSRALSKKQVVLWALLLVAIAFVLRIEKLPNVMNWPLQADARGFINISQSLTWGFDTLKREPLWVWLVWLITWVQPVPESIQQQGYLPLRCLSLVFSCAAVGMIYAFGNRFFSHRVGCFAALLFAVNKGMVYRSIQGLRLELFIILILAAIWLAHWLATEKKGKWLGKAVLFGLVSGLLLLLRTSGLPLFIVLLVWVFFQRRYSPLEPLAAIGITGVMIAPYYLYCWFQYGDPLYSANTHANFYYRLMLPEQGPDMGSISMKHLLFVVFPWYESAYYTLLGIADGLFGSFALRLFYLPISSLLIGCSLIGYLLFLRHTPTVLLLICLVVLLGPMAFFIGALKYHPGTFDWRLVCHLFPFMAYAAGEGLFCLLKVAGFNITPSQTD